MGSILPAITTLFVSPSLSATSRGLRRGQRGVAHAVAAHFELREDFAVVTMPTGSGKTAVLALSPFLLRARRALLVTPSRLVRHQIEVARDGKTKKRTASSQVPAADCHAPVRSSTSFRIHAMRRRQRAAGFLHRNNVKTKP